MNYPAQVIPMRPPRTPKTGLDGIHRANPFAISVPANNQDMAADGVVLTAEQERAVSAAALHIDGGRQRQVIGITGAAGTGKSTALKAIIDRLESSVSDIALAAPTHRAAARATELSGHRFQTLHSLAFSPVERVRPGKKLEAEAARRDLNDALETYKHCPTSEIGQAVAEARTRRGKCIETTFEISPSAPLGGSRALICDEAGMVSEWLAGQVGETFGLPALYIGDDAQLRPVGRPGTAYARSVLEKLPIAVRLDQIHRSGGPLMRFGADIRNGIAAEADGEAVQWMPRHFDAAFFDIFDVVIAHSNRDRRDYINMLRRFHGLDGPYPAPNDKVVLRSSLPDLGLFAGTSVRVSDFVPSKRSPLLGSATIQRLDDNGYAIAGPVPGVPVDISWTYWHVTKSQDDYPTNRRTGAVMLDFSWAITCHLAQGGEWGSVLVPKLPAGSRLSQDEFLRWVYTAVTRARQHLTISEN